MGSQVGVDLGSQRGRQHPAGAFTDQLVQVQDRFEQVAAVLGMYGAAEVLASRASDLGRAAALVASSGLSPPSLNDGAAITET